MRAVGAQGPCQWRIKSVEEERKIGEGKHRICGPMMGNNGKEKLIKGEAKYGDGWLSREMGSNHEIQKFFKWVSISKWGDGWLSREMGGYKLVPRLLARAALWVRIMTYKIGDFNKEMTIL
jgi:hypothetical protein